MSDPAAGAAWADASALRDRTAELCAPDRLLLAAALDVAVSEVDEAIAVLRACGIPDAETLPVGAADRLLLAAYRFLLGCDLEVVARCDSCGELNALALGPGDVPPHAPRTGWLGPGLGLREPGYADLHGLPAGESETTAELIRRCMIGPSSGGAGPDDPPTDRAAEALAEIDQSLCGAVIVDCVGCGVGLRPLVDVQQLVTAAVHAVVDEVDLEVHLLASRYGWDLATIEALPAARRTRLATLAGQAAW